MGTHHSIYYNATVWVRVLLWGLSFGMIISCGSAIGLETSQPDSEIIQSTITTEEGTDMNLDIAPDGQTILFDLLGQVFTIPAGGGEAVQLTEGMAWNSGAVFSPDGTKIAYLSDAGGITNIWLMDVNGNDKHKLTDEKIIGFRTGLEWHPDGRALLANRKIYYLQGGSADLDIGLRGELSFKGKDTLCSNTNGIQCFSSYGKHTQELSPKSSWYNRPVLSPNRRWLAYVNKYEFSDKKGGAINLELVNLKTGTHRKLLSNMDRWNSYWSRFVFAPDSQSILISYGGKIHRINILTGTDVIIPFHANVAVQHRLPVPFQYTIEDSLKVRYIRDVSMLPDQKTVIFSALSKIYRMDLTSKEVSPIIDWDIGVYHPDLSPDGKKLAFVSFDAKKREGDLFISDLKGEQVKKITKDSGYYAHPKWSIDGNRIAAFKANHKIPDRPIAFSKGSLYIWDLKAGTDHLISDAVRLNNSISFSADSRYLMYLREDKGKRVLEAVDCRTWDRKDLAITHADTEQVVVSPDGRYVAYHLLNNIYTAPLLPGWTFPITLAHDIKDVPILKLSVQVGGVDLQWSSDSQQLHWVSGNRIIQADIPMAFKGAVKNPSNNKIPIRVAKKYLDTLTAIDFTVPKKIPRGMLALRGGTLITMDKDSVIGRGTVLIKNNRIVDIGPVDNVRIPKEATVIDMRGKYIIPGMIDMHAHEFLPQGVVTRDWWAYREDLNFGVTTSRNPAFFYNYYGYHELSETGLMLAPRIYGAIAMSSFEVRFDSYKDALAQAKTYREMGGILFKVHDDYPRGERQWMVRAAREAGLRITAHNSRDNSSLSNQSIFLDGFNGMEHSFSLGTIHGDLSKLIQASKICITPTLITESGAFKRLLFHYKDRTYYPETIKNRFGDRLLNDSQQGEKADFDATFPKGSRGYDYAIRDVGLFKKGVPITAGSHTGYPGIELHWEMWLLARGGMRPYEALASSTIAAATAMGLSMELGSLAQGKLADLVILNKNPLLDIENSLSIDGVMKNGFLRQPGSLQQIWPEK